MSVTIPSDKELFPNLDQNHISNYAKKYREAVKDNLSELTAVASQNILRYGQAGAELSSAFTNDWFPPESHRSKELSEVEKQFNSAILDGSIDGFPATDDLWISKGDVLHTYYVSGNRSKAQIHYGNGTVGPSIKDYFSFSDDVSETGDYLTDFSYDLLRSDVITRLFPAFDKARKYLKAKKKQEDLNRSPGCSPKFLIICVLLTALSVYMYNHRILGVFSVFMMIIFGLLSIGGIFLNLPSSKDKNTIKLDDIEYHISPAEESKLKDAMGSEYLKFYRMYRYLKLWKKHMDESPDAYPEVLNCEGKSMIPKKLSDLDSQIKRMESDLQMYKTFPSTEGVKPVAD